MSSVQVLGWRSAQVSLGMALGGADVGFVKTLERAQGGCGWSVSAGTGLVVARRGDRCWSPPSALALYGLGWGLQFGGSLCDLLVVLRNQCAATHSGCPTAALLLCSPAPLLARPLWG